MITTIKKSWQSFNPVNQGSDIIQKKSGQPQPSAHFFKSAERQNHVSLPIETMFPGNAS